jgi:predicted NUDIX family NTP pyrophosphohydrolase
MILINLPDMKKSAGIIVFRKDDDQLRLLLVHPGGPFWMKKDTAAWSIPKGEFEEPENPMEAAKREFFEETGISITGNFIELTPVNQSGSKIVYSWAVEGNPDISALKSNSFTIEWPPNSGQKQNFPEIDKAAWFTIEESLIKIVKGQVPVIKQIQVLARKWIQIHP